jgi:glycolate oxidase FAD binding subunit
MTTLSDPIATAQGLWDEGAARAIEHGATADSGLLLEPRDTGMLAEMLKWATLERLVLVPRGGGTRLSRAPHVGSNRVDAVLSTSRLTGPIDHSPGDLVATIPAGWSLAAANEVLGRQGQRLPLDPPFSSLATIGGLVATDDSGPRRHRHGSPRDLILGTGMALTDGRLAKAGGRVVKNVAGYDLSRLLCGSWGTLAVITSATFKLSPVPAASCTLRAASEDLQRLARLALAIADEPLTPSALELDAPSGALLVRFESTATAVRRQAEAAQAVCTRHGVAADLLHGETEAHLWETSERRFWDADDTIVKMTVLPTQVPAVLECLESTARETGCQVGLTGRVADGVMFAGFSGPLDGTARGVERVRSQSASRGGQAIVVACNPSLTALIDPWGARDSAHSIARAVKAQFDPTGTLSTAWAGAWM